VLLFLAFEENDPSRMFRPRNRFISNYYFDFCLKIRPLYRLYLIYYIFYFFSVVFIFMVKIEFKYPDVVLSRKGDHSEIIIQAKRGLVQINMHPVHLMQIKI